MKTMTFPTIIDRIKFAVPFLAALAPSCTEGLDVYAPAGIGAVTRVYDVEAAGGTVRVDVRSDGGYTITRQPGDAVWLTVPDGAADDTGFEVQAASNPDVARMASLILCNTASGRTDTVRVRQRGLVEPRLQVAEGGWLLEASGPASFTVGSNVRAGDITPVVAYADGVEPWVTDIALADGGDGVQVTLTCEPNTGSTLRKAVLSLRFTDGWEETVSQDIYLTQKAAGGAAGTPVAIPSLRALAAEEGVVLEDDLVLEGIVVSVTASGNMGENEQTSPATVDYSLSDRTVYLQAADGSCGIRLITRSAEDNPFEPFDHVRIDLRGARLFRAPKYLASDPDFWWLEDVTGVMVVSRSAGSRSDVAAKVRHISELTDDDIYTYVTLADVELPVRKGPLTPINEGYANAGGANRTEKAAVLLHDIQGRSLYVLTNTTCPYRRTGRKLPYGSGSVSGILVHEHFRRFDYEDNGSGDEDTYGDIGRYQLRHTSLDDFALADDMQDASFSHLIAEWRYITAKNLIRYPATDGEDTGAWFTHSYQYPADHSLNGLSCVNMAVDYTYLGPVGTSDDAVFGKHIGNENGLGVVLADGTDWMAPGYDGPNAARLTTINNNSGHQGKGQVPDAVGSAWYVWYNKNTSTGQMQSYIIRFSTADIRSDHLSVQLSMLNFVNAGTYGPRYFNLEYSFTDATGLDDAQWTGVARFTVPDNANWSPTTQVWQSPGYKPMSFELPLSLLGREDVYLRLRPEDGHRGSTTAYDTGVSGNTTLAWTALDYIGIRCNQ